MTSPKTTKSGAKAPTKKEQESKMQGVYVEAMRAYCGDQPRVIERLGGRK